MNSDLQLIRTGDFDGIRFDCYQDGRYEFWGTREQIGEMLGYKNPRKAIKDIHLRNKGRLDKFSAVVKMVSMKGGPDCAPLGGEQETTVYNFKGLLEICRYSNQPKADAVMDFLWEMADQIRRTGRYAPALPEEHPKIELLERLSSEAPKRRVRIGAWHPFYGLIYGCMNEITQAQDQGFTWAQIEEAIYKEAVEKGLWRDDFSKRKIRSVYKLIEKDDRTLREWGCIA